MIWFIILILIFVIPFPIIMSFEYTGKLYLYIYFIKIQIENKFLDPEKHEIKEKSTARELNKMKYFSKENIKILFNKLRNNYIKPKISIDFKINYGFEDASFVALSYGTFYSLSPLLYRLINSIFKVKKYNYNVYPHYNKILFNFKFKSIIMINLVKIINILIIILSNPIYKQKSKCEFNK